MSFTVNPPYPVFTDVDGSPLEEGFIYIGLSNQDPQSNPTTVYWDAALTIPAAQPIRTSGGFPVRSGTPSVIYVAGDFSIRIRNKNGTIVFNEPTSPEVFIAQGILVYSGLFNVKAYGAKCDGVTNDAAAVAAADAAAAGRPLIFPGVTHIGTATTITSPIMDTMAQIFSATSQITINNKLPVRPEWWGNGNGTIRKAIAALPALGGDVQLSVRDYDMVNGWTRYDGNEKPNVRLIGAGMPIVTDDMTSYISGSGTVIRGMVLNFANGFEAYDLGVDVGTYVCNTFNGGQWMEGFVPGTHKLDHDGHDLQYYIRDVHFDNISCLQLPGGTAHGILIEHIIGVSHGYCETFLGLHGYVCKSQNVQGGDVRVYGQGGDAFIIKSDQYTLCQNVYINNIMMGDYNKPLTTAVGMIQGLTTNCPVAHVTIGSINAQKCAGVIVENGGNFVTDVQINNIYADQITGDAIVMSANCQRWNIGNHVLNVVGGRGIVVPADAQQINIGDGFVTNAGSHGYDLACPTLKHGSICCFGSAAWGVLRSGSCNINTDLVYGKNNTLGNLSTSYTRLTNANLVNSWTDVGTGVHPFQVVQVGKRVYFRGMVTGGSADTVCQLPADLVPGQVLNFVTYAITGGGARSFAQVDILADGTIQIPSRASLGAGCKVAFNFEWCY